MPHNIFNIAFPHSFNTASLFCEIADKKQKNAGQLMRPAL